MCGIYRIIKKKEEISRNPIKSFIEELHYNKYMHSLIIQILRSLVHKDTNDIISYRL
jgi:hypothetical protein